MQPRAYQEPKTWIMQTLLFNLKTGLEYLEKCGPGRAEANLFRRIDMAPEIFVVYLQSAIGPQDEPCLPILTLAKEPQIGVSSNVQVGLAG